MGAPGKGTGREAGVCDRLAMEKGLGQAGKALEYDREGSQGCKLSSKLPK